MDQRNRAGLSLVTTVGSECCIYRETTGSFVVSHDKSLRDAVRVATLPCAYAACREWEHRHHQAPINDAHPTTLPRQGVA